MKLLQRLSFCVGLIGMIFNRVCVGQETSVALGKVLKRIMV